MASLRAALFGILVLALAVGPPGAYASRPATAEERAAFIEAAEREPHPFTHPYKPGIREARVSTVDAKWAAAVLWPAPGGDPGTVLFEDRPLKGWRFVMWGGDCGFVPATPAPIAVRRDLFPSCPAFRHPRKAR